LLTPPDSTVLAPGNLESRFTWTASRFEAPGLSLAYDLWVRQGADSARVTGTDTARTLDLATLGLNLAPGDTLTWWVQAVCGKHRTDSRSRFTLVLADTLSGVDPTPVASGFGLVTAYPNPFNATTTITYALARPGVTELAIYDLQGRRVTTLINAAQPAGAHRVTWDAAAAPSGTYFVRLQSGATLFTQKLLLLK
jgi:hypothetical protein